MGVHHLPIFLSAGSTGEPSALSWLLGALGDCIRYAVPKSSPLSRRQVRLGSTLSFYFTGTGIGQDVGRQMP